MPPRTHRFWQPLFHSFSSSCHSRSVRGFFRLSQASVRSPRFAFERVGLPVLVLVAFRRRGLLTAEAVVVTRRVWSGVCSFFAARTMAS